jgi:hypothetical protein
VLVVLDQAMEQAGVVVLVEEVVEEVSVVEEAVVGKKLDQNKSLERLVFT